MTCKSVMHVSQISDNVLYNYVVSTCIIMYVIRIVRDVIPEVVVSRFTVLTDGIYSCIGCYYPCTGYVTCKFI